MNNSTIILPTPLLFQVFTVTSLLFQVFTITYQVEIFVKEKTTNLSSNKINSALHSGQLSGQNSGFWSHGSHCKLSDLGQTHLTTLSLFPHLQNENNTTGLTQWF